jgi:O-antigen/teichoic acid export membrane protein
VTRMGWKWRWRPGLMWLLARPGVAFALALFVLGLNYRVSILLLQLFVGSSDIGQFSLGVNISEMVWVVPSAIGMVVFSHSTGAGDPKALAETTARITRLALIVAAAVAAAMAVSCDALVGLVYGEAYRAGVPVVQSMLPGIVCVVFFKILNCDLAGRGHPLVAAKIFLGAIAVNVAATCLLTPRWGIVGAGVAVSISYAFGSLAFARTYAEMSGLRLRELLVPRMDDFRELVR